MKRNEKKSKNITLCGTVYNPVSETYHHKNASFYCSGENYIHSLSSRGVATVKLLHIPTLIILVRALQVELYIGRSVNFEQILGILVILQYTLKLL